MKNIIIIGASGHGKVILDIVEKTKNYNSIAFLDDIKKGEFLGYRILGTLDDYYKYLQTHDFIIAIGSNEIRKKIATKLIKNKAKIARLIHPSSIISSNVSIGIGTVIMANVVINSCSKIGDFCIINTASSIDHDCEICDFTHISPGVNIAGNVQIGENCWIGIGSAVINNKVIRSNVLIGAGSVVVKDIKEEGIYYGVPAKQAK